MSVVSFKGFFNRWRTRWLDRQLIRQSGLFDPSYYLQKYPDVRRAGVNPLQHYLNRGRFEARSPSNEFDPTLYVEAYPDVSPTGLDPFVHYISYGRQEGRRCKTPQKVLVKSTAVKISDSGLFDPEYYRTLYLDVASSGVDPFEHYMTVGRLEQRKPSADFDPAIYWAARPDVKRAGVDPLLHFIETGRTEGPQRLHNGLDRSEITELLHLIKQSGLFDSDYYLRQCPTVRDAAVDPVLHYLISGFASVVCPSPAFTDLEHTHPQDDVSPSKWKHLLEFAEVASMLGLEDTLVSRRSINNPLQFEMKAGETYFKRFQFDGEANSGQSAYVLDAIADLVCRTPNLAIDRMHSDVSIIIPAFGQLPFVLSCLDSLSHQHSCSKVEIILADDASACEEFAFLEAIPWIRYIRRNKNGGFINNCNDAAKFAHGRILVFLNSDTRVVQGWLDELVNGFQLYPKAGLIGSSLCNSDGTLQEAGGIYWSDGSAWNYGRGEDPLHPKYCFARQVDYISAASIAVRSDVWHQMGGFDVLFCPAYCEDADLAFKLRSAGYEVWLQPLSRVIHFEGKSNGRHIHKGVKRYQPLNMRKFAERWQDALADHGVHGQDPDKAANRTVRDRVLVLDATTPTPDRDSGSFITFRMMTILQELGYQITFVPEHNYLYDQTYTTELQRRGIECLYKPHFREIEDVLNFQDSFDVIFAYRHDVLSSLYSKLRERLPSARLIFHNVDLHFLRQEREAELFDNRSKKIAAAVTRAAELELVAQADCTIVHTADEAEVIRKYLPSTNLVEFRYLSELHRTSIAFEERFDVMFLGGFRHPPNVDAVKHFVNVIWPRLAPRLPDQARFIIIGPDPPSEIRKLSGPRVVVTGYVSDLQPYFERARVFVAPLRYGAGIKGKVIQSLSYGTPTVISAVAAEGIGVVSGCQTLVAENDEAFSEAVALLYFDKVLWYSVQATAYQFVEEHFSKEAGMKLMSKVLDRADATWLARHNRELDKRLKMLMGDSPLEMVESTHLKTNSCNPALHYYSPLVDSHDPNVIAQLKQFGTAELPVQSGIRIDQEKMIDFFRSLSEHYDRLPFPEQKQRSSLYYYNNPFFSYGDAIVLALIMLTVHPERMIEVGSGFSSAAMIDVNEKLLGGQIQLTFIDPFPERLLSIIPTNSRYLNQIMRSTVQAVPLDHFRQLRKGDILFIDSTHVSKTASDINFLIFDAFPLLEPGVLIHIHDIFFPFEYPPEWIIDENRSWNEAYLIRAFLQFNPNFEIVFFNDFAFRKFTEEIRTRTPLFAKNSGGSLWIKKV